MKINKKNLIKALKSRRALPMKVVEGLVKSEIRKGRQQETPRRDDLSVTSAAQSATPDCGQALGPDPSVRWDRVLAIRTAIGQGTYTIPASAFVDRLLSHARQLGNV